MSRSLLAGVLLSASVGLLVAMSASASPAVPAPTFLTPPGRPGLAVPPTDLASHRPWLEQQHSPRPTSREPIEPDPLDVHWRPGFGLPVPDRGVSALLVNGRVLVVGGSFERIGEFDAPGLAAWDGGTWSLIGDFPGSYVTDLAPYPGGFVAISSGGGALVWRWTGSAWESWHDPSIFGSTTALAVQDTSVAVAIGYYEQGTTHFRVQVHTPSGWTVLGEDFDDYVQALAWYNGTLYAAGQFHHVGDTAAAAVARWDGASWQALSAELPHSQYFFVRTLAVYRDELVAAGYFNDPSDATAPNSLARWNGTRWASLGTDGPPFPNVSRLRVVGSDLYAVGSFWTPKGSHGISRWDGTTWYLDGDRLQSFVQDVALFQNELNAGGYLASNGEEAATPLVRRQGSDWKPAVPGPGMHGFLGSGGPVIESLVSIDRGVVAAGQFDFAGTTGGWRRCKGVALWNGGEWSPLGLESWEYANPYHLTTHNGALVAIGSFTRDRSHYGPVVAWSGGAWDFVGQGDGDPFPNAFTAVSAFGNLFIGGYRNVQDPFHGIARWDGSTWNEMGGGITNGDYVSSMADLSGIANVGEELVVAGHFHEVDGVACENVAAWSPTAGWHPLGAGLRGSVYDLTTRNGVLYAAGDLFVDSTSLDSFTTLARWQDGRWEPVRPRIGTPNTLGWYRGQLVAGAYENLSVLAADSTWHRLGSGTNGYVESVAEWDGSLYVGGQFSRAGANAAYGFAEWREAEDFSLPVAPPMTSAPNPSASAVHLRYALSADSHARIEVFDLAGHRVDTVFDGVQSAGDQDVVWNPSAARVKAGVYFARLTIAASSRVVRVVRVPGGSRDQ